MSAVVTILALLLAAAGPGTLDGRKLPDGSLDFSEFVIDTGLSTVEVDQTRPSVAFDGMNYFVVWQDGRGSAGADIYGTRATPDGELLDPTGIAICTTYNQQWSPCVAPLDTVYLVVWYDRRSENSGDIFGARVTRSGRVLDPASIVICRVQGAQESPVVVGGDTGWFVAWQDNRTEWDIRGTCVSRSGVVQYPGGRAVGIAPSQQLYPVVAYSDQTFLVVWQSNQYGPWTLWGARVSTSGHVLDPQGFFIAGDISQNVEPSAASVAGAGGDFLVAWQNSRTPKYGYAKRISGDGVPIEPTIPLPQVGVTQQNLSVAACGTAYLVTWEDRRGSPWDIYGARITSSGLLLDTLAIPVAIGVREQFDVAATGGNGQWCVAWADKRFDPDQSCLFACILDTTGAPLESGFRASTPARLYCGYAAPVIAACDSGYVAVWESRAPIGSSGWNTEVCAARLDHVGRLMDTASFTVAGRARDQLAPAIASGDSNLLVAWAWGSYYTGVYATRLGCDGSILDPGWITLTESGDAPDAAFDGTNYLVVWRESRNVYGARVTQAGAVLDRIDIAAWSVRDSAPAVSFDGENYLVCWQCGDVIWGSLVTPEGTLVNPSGFCVSGTGHRAWSPAVASNGTGFFVAWVDYRTSWCEIFGTRVDSAGRVLDSAGIMVSRWGYWPYYERDPCVASDGSDYVVLWNSDYDETELHGSVISANGIRTDTFVLSTMPMNAPLPACAYGPDERFLAVFSAVKDPNGGGRDTLTRIYGSFVSTTTGVANMPPGGRDHTALSVHPNPFSRTVRLQPGHDHPGPDASLIIRDAAGRCVRTFSAVSSEGMTWDGTDAAGRRLPAGIYFCTFRSGGTTAKEKLAKLE